MRRLAQQAHPGVPVTIYYAFKQSETKGDSGTASTSWETFLDAVIRSGFAISRTWPMRTELGNRMVGMGTNALASSIVLVCRRRPDDALTATRRELLTALRTELPPALRLLQTGNVAPVDLAQAAIGPGMAVYTRYARALVVVVIDAAVPPVGVAAFKGHRDVLVTVLVGAGPVPTVSRPCPARRAPAAGPARAVARVVSWADTRARRRALSADVDDSIRSACRAA